MIQTSTKIKRSIVDKNTFIRFYGLFVLTVFSVYFLPAIFNRLFFLVLLVLIWKSNCNYFWFAFIFILINGPGALFGGALRGMENTSGSIPSFILFRGIGFTFFDLFVIMIFIKALMKGEKPRILFKNQFIFLLAYLAILYLYSFTIGLNLETAIDYLRLFIIYSLFYSFPALIKNHENYLKIGYLLSPIVFFIFLTQIYTILTGNFLIAFFVGSSAIKYFRPSLISSGLIFIVLFNFSVFLIDKKYQYNKKYLYLVQNMCFIIFFLSATRALITIMIIFYFLYNIFVVKQIKYIVSQGALLLILLIGVTFFIPEVKDAAQYSIDRFNTLQKISKGQYSGFEVKGSGVYRITTRFPRIMKAIKKSPIIGLGFGKEFQSIDELTGSINGDFHVGNFNLVANCGIIGFFLFTFFWIRALTIIQKAKKAVFFSKDENKKLNVMLIAFLCLLVQHFTSAQIFGYTINQKSIYFVVFFMLTLESIVISSVKEKQNLKNLFELRER
ncbi:MAG: O-antigen ligase family protein [Thermodesulfovibrionales bacterium]|nr:O-antigen ligase family protein [Thermodesulfovibrionales bacterium]